MNTTFWGGNVTAIQFTSRTLTWKVERSDGLPDLDAQVQIKRNHRGIHVAWALANAWNLKSENDDVLAVPALQAVYFSGSISAMSFKVVPNSEFTPVPSDGSAIEVVSGLFVHAY